MASAPTVTERRPGSGSFVTRASASPRGVRTAMPSVWPQYPYDEEPHTPERSAPRYELVYEPDVWIEMRDGVRLMADIHRPYAPAGRFPALVCFSPYGRRLQRDSAAIGQNEAGIVEFWVPRGYVQVIVDARGCCGSEGVWANHAPEEGRDLYDVIEWAAAQPWCDGNVGMMGCSYFGIAQLQAALNRPPSLKAIFPYDAWTDKYRHGWFSGGIPNDFMSTGWTHAVSSLNFWSGLNTQGPDSLAALREERALEHPFDGSHHWEHGTWRDLHRLDLPAYFGCDWGFHGLHLPGAFDGWQRSGEVRKRMLIGPRPYPGRPFAAYHQEALRWYDQWLKGLDTGVMDGQPIRLWIRGEDRWRGEDEWPLARTEWRDLFLGGSGEQLSLSDEASASGQAQLAYDPADEPRYLRGEPRLAYRSEPVGQPLEVTGPVQLTMTASSSADDADWIVILQDEAPDGSLTELTRGWLRSSHRAIDPERGRVNEPWHPHDRSEPLTPGEEVELEIGLVPTCNVFRPGHRIRLELANCDSVDNTWYRRTLLKPATNTVVHGPSRLSLPVISS